MTTTPAYGDRSARDVSAYPDAHASDIEDGTFIYHKDPDAPGGGAAWGSIAGTIGNQTDLIAKLDAKQRVLALKPFIYIYPAGTSAITMSSWGAMTQITGSAAIDDSVTGYMIQRSTTTGSTNGVGHYQTVPYFCRGNNHFRGGFYSFLRIGFTEKTGLYFYDGFASTAVLAFPAPIVDDPGGHYAMFQYSPTRGGGDTNFQFITKDNVTPHVTDTGMAAAINKVYEFTIYCPMNSASIAWKISNITDATEVSGSETNNLPDANTNLACLFGIINQSGTTAKKFRQAWFWAEPDNVDTP